MGSGCCSSASRIRRIEAHSLNQFMQEEPALVVINVLASKFYNDCHIKGSISIPLDDLEAQVKDWDKQKLIVVYCAFFECNASQDAYKKLKALDFVNVAVYEGGIKEWKKLGLPTEGPCHSSYLTEPDVLDNNCSSC